MMTEEEKKRIIKDFLYEKAFKPMLDYAKENNDKKIIKIVNKTMTDFQRKDTARGMVNLYNDIVEHKTSSMEATYVYLNQKGINTKLEDVI